MLPANLIQVENKLWLFPAFILLLAIYLLIYSPSIQFILFQIRSSLESFRFTKYPVYFTPDSSILL